MLFFRDLTQFVAFTAYYAIGLALKATLQLGNSLYTLGNYTLVLSTFFHVSNNRRYSFRGPCVVYM